MPDQKIAADVLELMRRAIALAGDPSYLAPEPEPVSRYCPPEIRYDYRGN